MPKSPNLQATIAGNSSQPSQPSLASALATQAAVQAASLRPTAPGIWTLAGEWSVHGLGNLPVQLLTLPLSDSGASARVTLDGSALTGFDSAGAWVLQDWLRRHQGVAEFQHWQTRWQSLMSAADEHAKLSQPQTQTVGAVAQVGLHSLGVLQQGIDLLSFIGNAAQVAVVQITHSRPIRWRSVWHHVQLGGLEALPIVGLMSFLMGVVVAYQGADQLKHYGASIFVVDLVGYAMLREFAPLMTAIIIAGRSGSSYTAQIGTMVVTEEIDAMRTIGIDPTEQLVLPRILALSIALPLLTVFADIAGVTGGMVMARTQLDIGYYEFIDRFGRELQGNTLLLGLGKSLVFAVVIAMIGCFQGFRTQGSADSVGRQTTRSVVQAIFVVIAADAAFSVIFNLLDI